METLNCHPRAAVAAQYREESCTLDGQPARVIAWMEPFAIVRTMAGADVEFSWPTVARIMADGGNFRS